MSAGGTRGTRGVRGPRSLGVARRGPVRGSRARPLALSLALLGALACSATGAVAPDLTDLDHTDDLDPGTPRLVIAGGALSSATAEVWRAFVEARHGSGPLCVLPTASGNPEASGASAAETLRAHAPEAEVRVLLLTVDNAGLATQAAFSEELRRCSGYWFTGGSQSRITRTFRPNDIATKAWQTLVDRHAQGAVIGGSSAGAAMMSSVMIAGGSSRDAIDHGLASSDDDPGVDIQPGMHLFDAGVIDQHFLARGRIGRLLVTVLEHPEVQVGFGIDENTALVVEADSAHVLGASGVVIVDGRNAASSGGNLHIWLAGQGDRFSLADLVPRVDPDKARLAPSNAVPPAPHDLFDRWVFLHWLDDFARTSSDRFTVDAGNGATLEWAKSPGFSAHSVHPSRGPDDTPAGLSLGRLGVRLQR